MKKSLKIAFLAVALVLMTGCSAQRRAERMVRRAVNLCPELVQMKAHPIDTVLTAPAFADMVALHVAKVMSGDTLYAATDHGTVVVSLRQADSVLRVGFIASPQEIHYRDTLRYQQVVVNTTEAKRTAFWSHVALWLVGIGLGMSLCFFLFRTLLIKRRKQ